MDSILKEWRGICPHCENPIIYTVAHLHCENDKGSVIVECNKCNKQMFVKIGVVNSEYLNVHNGGTIIESLNDWEHNSTPVLRHYEWVKSMLFHRIDYIF